MPFLISTVIWQQPDRLVFLSQSQIDNLFQLPFCPGWHHFICPSVTPHPLPWALLHPRLPSSTPLCLTTEQKSLPEQLCPLPGSELHWRPETKPWPQTIMLHNVTPGGLASGSAATIKSSALNGLRKVNNNRWTMDTSAAEKQGTKYCHNGDGDVRWQAYNGLSNLILANNYFKTKTHNTEIWNIKNRESL